LHKVAKKSPKAGSYTPVPVGLQRLGAYSPSPYVITPTYCYKSYKRSILTLTHLIIVENYKTDYAVKLCNLTKWSDVNPPSAHHSKHWILEN